MVTGRMRFYTQLIKTDYLDLRIHLPQSTLALFVHIHVQLLRAFLLVQQHVVCTFSSPSQLLLV